MKTQTFQRALTIGVGMGMLAAITFILLAPQPEKPQWAPQIAPMAARSSNP